MRDHGLSRPSGIRQSVRFLSVSRFRSCVCRKPRPFDLVKESRNVGHDGRTALHGANAPAIGPRCAGLSPGSADRTQRVACPGWRTASPIRPDLRPTYSRPPRPVTAAFRMSKPAICNGDDDAWPISTSGRTTAFEAAKAVLRKLDGAAQIG